MAVKGLMKYLKKKEKKRERRWQVGVFHIICVYNATSFNQVARLWPTSTTETRQISEVGVQFTPLLK